MASRLSDVEIRSVFDGGQQALAIEYPRTHDLWAETLAGVDLDRLAAREDAEQAIQAVPAQDAYRSLMRKGLSDSLEVLPLLSSEQIVRIFDYDVWRDDRLAHSEVGKWLALWREIGNEELYRRYRGLDEEYQTAFLSGLVELFDEEEYERLSPSEQDSLTRLPCNTLFYRLKTDDSQLAEQIGALIEAALSEDVAYAYSLLNHAAYLPPNESEAMLVQFRRARLEEDGFVSFEDSLGVFVPLAYESYRQKWGPAGKADLAHTHAGKREIMRQSRAPSERSLLLQALDKAAAEMPLEAYDALLHSFVHLGNALCAACRISTEDLAGQRRVLNLAQGLTNLGLELLVGADLERAVRVLGGEHPQVLFRLGLGAVRRLAEATLARLAVVCGETKTQELIKQLKLGRHGALLQALDVDFLPILGFERVEMLKGLCNRFPLLPTSVQDLPDAASPHRIIFVPVDSLARLSDLAASCDQLSATLCLLEQALAAAKNQLAADTLRGSDIDRLLATAIGRALSGASFAVEPLNAEQLAALEAMDQNAVQSLTADLSQEVEQGLKTLSGWQLSAQFGDLFEPLALTAAMRGFSDNLMVVLAARERARHENAVAPWRGVLLVQELVDYA